MQGLPINAVVRLGNDPEPTYIKSGTLVLNLRVAFNYRAYRDGQWKDETIWLNLRFFGEKQIESVTRKHKKGEIAYITGFLQTREYVKDGQTRISHDVVSPTIDWVPGTRQGHGDGGESSGMPEADETPFSGSDESPL